ncbi:hypothetical protein LEMLEM_LOCUS10583 [Lemmus lemmus]
MSPEAVQNQGVERPTLRGRSKRIGQMHPLCLPRSSLEPNNGWGASLLSDTLRDWGVAFTPGFIIIMLQPSKEYLF